MPGINRSLIRRIKVNKASQSDRSVRAQNSDISQVAFTAQTANVASSAESASYAATASYAESASFSSTSSFSPLYLPLTGGTITGNVTVNGTASISFLNVTYESSSIIYSSGSNQFGDAVNDVQILIGSTKASGSLEVTGSTTLQTLNVLTSLTASGLKYPTADSGEESFIQTDGNGNLSLQYVSTIYETVYNSEVTTLTKGTPVYISGSQGANAKVFRADPLIASKMPAVYVIADNITAGATGRGIALGLIKGVNTTGYPAGTEIYLAPGGGWTAIRPTGSAIIQVLGYVTKEGSGGQGVILNPGPANLPNLPSGSVWVGNSNSVPISTLTSSLSVLSSSYALTASYALNGGGGGIVDTSSLVTTSSFNNFTSSYYIDSASFVANIFKERRYDSSASFAYCGTAVYGSLEANSVWSITRIFISSSGATTITSASMVDWTNRYTHTYY